MKKLYFLASVCFLLFGVQNLYAQSGGNGTAGSPYQIKNCDDLQAMEKYKSAYWELMNDIDCSATKNGTGQWSSSGFRPVGDSVGRFSGNFNGNCYHINNLYINRPGKNYVGLFGYTDSSANISHVQILNADITGHNFTGIAIGMKLSTYFDDCSTSGKVNGANYTGGVVGMSDNYQGTAAAITNSSSSATVNGTNFTGGVVGKITTFQGGASYVTNCFATGNVTGNNSTGGVAGDCGTYQGGGAELQYCYSSGMVTGNDSVGGLVGNMGPIMGGGSYIIQSYSTGNVSGKTDVGGLAGFNGPNSGGGSTVYDSYSQGSVTGTTNVGGLIGYEIATGSGYGIDTCYSTGVVTGTTNVGGFTGDQSNTPVFATDYWDSTANITLKSVGNLGSVSGITPASTGQMQLQPTYVSWNFTSIWSISASSFPVLFPSPSGGTCNFPNTLAAAFNFTPDSTCAGDTVYFTDMSINSPTAWHWNFGDPGSGSNDSSTLQNPVHIFTAMGTFTVTLVVTKGINKDTATALVKINCAVLGLQQITKQNSVNVYPNPGIGNYILSIENTMPAGNKLDIYNALGEKVYSARLTGNNTHCSIDLSNQPGGIFLYRLTTDTGALINEGKIIKQ